MESPLYQRWAKLEERLDLRLDSLSLLRENRSCWIYRGSSAGETVVVKQYKHHARNLCEREARALGLYSQICSVSSHLLRSEVRALNAQTGSLCVTFIEGDLMSDVLRARAWSRREQRRCGLALERVSELLLQLRERTRSDNAPSPFLEEYLVHASRHLERTPGLRRLFAGYVASARRLYEELKDAAEETSLSHGDLVCANLILCGDHVGVIDFANANPESHPLDDVYNMQVTLEHLLHLPRSVRHELSSAVAGALDLTSTDPRTRSFYWEYHKRRWLYLQLNGGWARRARTLALLPYVLSRSPPPEADALHRSSPVAPDTAAKPGGLSRAHRKAENAP